MSEKVYTHALWRVKPGRESEFIAEWKSLGAVFLSLPQPPFGKGTLIQSATDPTVFYSFGAWQRADHVTAMRADPRAQSAFATLRELCSEMTPGLYRIIAELPEE